LTISNFSTKQHIQNQSDNLMKLAYVRGNVVCTVKDPQLEGVKLRIIEPVDSSGKAQGGLIVAADSVSAGDGQLVWWVAAREATYCLPDKKIPVDAAIVGIVDQLG
jgi:ethanolamine utilization protein EutN